MRRTESKKDVYPRRFIASMDSTLERFGKNRSLGERFVGKSGCRVSDGVVREVKRYRVIRCSFARCGGRLVPVYPVGSSIRREFFGTIFGTETRTARNRVPATTAASINRRVIGSGSRRERRDGEARESRSQFRKIVAETTHALGKFSGSRDSRTTGIVNLLRAYRRYL